LPLQFGDRIILGAYKDSSVSKSYGTVFSYGFNSEGKFEPVSTSGAKTISTTKINLEFEVKQEVDIAKLEKDMREYLQKKLNFKSDDYTLDMQHRPILSMRWSLPLLASLFGSYVLGSFYLFLN